MEPAAPLRLCLSSHHRGLAALGADPEFAAGAAAELVELRLDNCVDAGVGALAAAVARLRPERCVVTCRRAAEGGGGAVPEAGRLPLLLEALRLGVAFVDVELHAAAAGAMAPLRAARRPPSRLVVSHHVASGCPPLAALRAWRQQAEALGADVVKLVVAPADLVDALPLAQLLAEATPWRRPLLGLATGAAGQWSRLLAGRGARPPPFTLARAEGAAGTAPGQLPLTALAGLYRVAAVRPDTPVWGIIGSPLGHSLSPLLHNTALQAQGRAGIYVPLPLRGSPLPFLAHMAPLLGLRGLSVTAPHKQAVLPACASQTRLCRRIGAANTLWWTAAGAWAADNTDAPAAVEALQRALGGGRRAPLGGRHVVLLGAGGAARAVACGLRRAGAQLSICNRSAAAAAALGAHVDARVVRPEQLRRLRPAPCAVVNATSVGMAQDAEQTPLAAALLPGGALVFDLLYGAAPSCLLRQAAAAGHPTLDGRGMFVAQARAQLRRFTGAAAAAAPLRRLVDEALRAVPSGPP